MQSQEESLRNQIALGWVMNGVVLAFVLLTSIVEASMMNNNFRAIRIDPGTSLKWLVYVFAAYQLMPVYIHLVHGRRSRLFRWIAVALAALGFIFFLLHHLSHWTLGQRPDLSSHVYDLTIEVISLWVLFNSIKWARSPRPAAE